MIDLTNYVDPLTTALTSVSPQGLIPYLDSQIGVTFAGLEVKNYGFTGKQLDLNRQASGFRVPKPGSEGFSLHQELCTEQVIIAKIMPIAPRVQGVVDTTHIKLYFFVRQKIREWVNCRSGSFGITNDYKFEITGVRDIASVQGLPSNDPRSLWHVLSWEFPLRFYA